MNYTKELKKYFSETKEKEEKVEDEYMQGLNQRQKKRLKQLEKGREHQPKPRGYLSQIKRTITKD